MIRRETRLEMLRKAIVKSSAARAYRTLFPTPDAQLDIEQQDRLHELATLAAHLAVEHMREVHKDDELRREVEDETWRNLVLHGQVINKLLLDKATIIPVEEFYEVPDLPFDSSSRKGDSI